MSEKTSEYEYNYDKRYEVQGDEELEILGIKLFPTNREIDFYILYIGDVRPAYFDNRLIVFSDLLRAPVALATSNCGASQLKLPEPLAVSRTFNFLYTINSFLYQDQLFVHHPGETVIPFSEESNCLTLLADHFFDTKTKKERKKDTAYQVIQGTINELFLSADTDISGWDKRIRQKLINNILQTIGKIAITARFIN